MEEIALKTQGLSKKFRSYKKRPGLIGSLKSFYQREAIDKYAVDHFDLEIKKGEIVGLLGPNGAGKTTLMKMFTGIIVPSEGEIVIGGNIPHERSKSFRQKMALVMGQKSQLWWDIPAMDSFLLIQKYYEIPQEDFEKRLASMAKLLGVEDQLHIHVRKLSLGERMKLELMASLLHSPDIIFLDEPTIGLDIMAQENIRKFLLDYHREHQCTVIINSHYMADVQALCQRLVLIMGGKKAFDGRLSQFENLLGTEKKVGFSFADQPNRSDEIFSRFDAQWAEDGQSVELAVPEEKMKEVGLAILGQYAVTEFNTEKMPIERVMKTLMEKPEIVENLK